MSDDFTKSVSKVYGKGIPQSMLNLVPQEELYALVGMSFNMKQSEEMAQDV